MKKALSVKKARHASNVYWIIAIFISAYIMQALQQMYVISKSNNSSIDCRLQYASICFFRKRTRRKGKYIRNTMRFRTVVLIVPRLTETGMRSL